MTGAPPKRDLLPSQRGDWFARQLDDTYTRGFMLGRAAGLEYAAKLLRDANIPNIGDILAEITRNKYPS